MSRIDRPRQTVDDHAAAAQRAASAGRGIALARATRVEALANIILAAESGRAAAEAAEAAAEVLEDAVRAAAVCELAAAELAAAAGKTVRWVRKVAAADEWDDG